MIKAGPNSGSTFVNDTTVGNLNANWIDVINAKDSDQVYTSIASGVYGLTSYYLKVTGFAFSIPVGATILGILVEVERYEGDTDVCDYSLKIVKGGSIGGTEKASVSIWPIAEAYASYGGSSDLWGLSWTPADINDPTFGMVISAIITGSGVAYIDHIRISVYYRIAGQVIINTE